jgi:hypothetical protein
MSGNSPEIDAQLDRRERVMVKQAAQIVALATDRRNLGEALRDLLNFWDNREASGWTAAEVGRLVEIRALVEKFKEV